MQTQEARRKAKRAKREFIRDFKRRAGCAICHERNPEVLDLDHLDPATKTRNHLGQSTHWVDLGWKRLVEEIESCQVLCANCHRRRTSTQFGWYNQLNHKESSTMSENEGWQEFKEVDRDEDDEAWASPEESQEPPAEDSDREWTPSFNAKWRNEFEGLVYLGHLQAEVKIPYHSFTVRTLTTGEKIRVIALVRDHEQSIGYARAYRAAIVSAGLVLVDGKPLLVGQKNLDVIPQRYRYITDNWYDYVIDLLYDKINELEGQVLEVLKELGVYQTRREVVVSEEAEVAGAIPQPEE